MARDSRPGPAIRSTQRYWMPRRASSIESTQPTAPPPTMRTGISLLIMIDRPSLISHRTSSIGPPVSTPLSQRVDHCACLVERFQILVLRVRVGDDASPGAEVDSAILKHRCPDRDIGVELSRHAPVANRAAVDTTPRRLQLRDDLHR